MAIPPPISQLGILPTTPVRISHSHHLHRLGMLEAAVQEIGLTEVGRRAGVEVLEVLEAARALMTEVVLVGGVVVVQVRAVCGDRATGPVQVLQGGRSSL
jgi:hypothetical protein